MISFFELNIWWKFHQVAHWYEGSLILLTLCKSLRSLCTPRTLRQPSHLSHPLHLHTSLCTLLTLRPLPSKDMSAAAPIWGPVWDHSHPCLVWGPFRGCVQDPSQGSVQGLCTLLTHCTSLYIVLTCPRLLPSETLSKALFKALSDAPPEALSKTLSKDMTEVLLRPAFLYPSYPFATSTSFSPLIPLHPFHPCSRIHPFVFVPAFVPFSPFGPLHQLFCLLHHSHLLYLWRSCHSQK